MALSAMMIECEQFIYYLYICFVTFAFVYNMDIQVLVKFMFRPNLLLQKKHVLW